ncbi:hypothetical protein FOL47_004402, partial [Perkinsus chesapeaki]
MLPPFLSSQYVFLFLTHLAIGWVLPDALDCSTLWLPGLEEQLTWADYLRIVEDAGSHPEDSDKLSHALRLSRGVVIEAIENEELRETGYQLHIAGIMQLPPPPPPSPLRHNATAHCITGVLFATYNFIKWTLSSPEVDDIHAEELKRIGRDILSHYIQYPGNDADTSEASMFPFTSADLEIILANSPGQISFERSDAWSAAQALPRDGPLMPDAHCSPQKHKEDIRGIRLAAISEHMQFVVEAATMALEGLTHRGPATLGTYFAKLRHVTSDKISDGTLQVEDRRSYDALWDGLQGATLEHLDAIMTEAWTDEFIQQADVIMCVDVALWICALMHRNRPP